ncbi:hypothetical protein IMG5_092110 [Ichthyophthirius multifiliis]|uniref:Transmembrane protein n=1 Tax=Ichthyophthirius multifiliis TaxID=5932 RepID=G0QRD8_ICHMU|nr:hypothetical protein IMG5_092110 [Ichthyophthirius multifiliis]EGR32207.1 hypothetical protein IMG5_092110 [Ichthyophthirius multifiliis]|eukprot:XP_004035693.1 hypothetical protein IMG5_092110 [Ichthyophthirius multifiliis]
MVKLYGEQDKKKDFYFLKKFLCFFFSVKNQVKNQGIFSFLKKLKKSTKNYQKVNFFLKKLTNFQKKLKISNFKQNFTFQKKNLFKKYKFFRLFFLEFSLKKYKLNFSRLNLFQKSPYFKKKTPKFFIFFNFFFQYFHQNFIQLYFIHFLYLNCPFQQIQYFILLKIFNQFNLCLQLLKYSQNLHFFEIFFYFLNQKYIVFTLIYLLNIFENLQKFPFWEKRIQINNQEIKFNQKSIKDVQILTLN